MAAIVTLESVEESWQTVNIYESDCRLASVGSLVLYSFLLLLLYQELTHALLP